ncbi:hypothetical protein ABZP36_015926 [Zizania latifolia]
MSASSLLPLLLGVVVLLLPAIVRSQATAPVPRWRRLQQQQCPLNFTALRPFLAPPLPEDDSGRCLLAVQSVRLLLALHLAATGSFVLPANASCLPPLRAALQFTPSACGLSGLDGLLASPGCGNVSTLRDFDAAVPAAARRDMNASCDRDLDPVPDCTACTTSLSKAAAAYLLPGSLGGGNNVTGCVQYPFIYAGAAASPRGADDPATAYCLFLLKVNYANNARSGVSGWVYGVVFGCVALVLLVAAAAGFWFLVRRKRRRAAAAALAKAASDSRSKRSQAMESISASTTLVQFTYDEIKAATGGFARESMIGRGGFGNVYKGVLPDGTEVAVKRFKNCSAAGDAAFAHEVEVVASVRHVNLVAIRGEWAWSLVQRGKTLDVIQEGMAQTGPSEKMEKYVLVAALCTHPQLHARPTMEQVAKILEADSALGPLLIPERPLSVVANLAEIERSASSSGSGQLFSPSGFRSFTHRNEDAVLESPKET